MNDAFSDQTHEWEQVSTYKNSYHEPNLKNKRSIQHDAGLEKIESIPITDKSLQVVIIDSEQIDGL